jgi:hypothetical protein
VRTLGLHDDNANFQHNGTRLVPIRCRKLGNARSFLQILTSLIRGTVPDVVYWGVLRLIPFIIAEQLRPFGEAPRWRDYAMNILISRPTAYLSLPRGIAAGPWSCSLLCAQFGPLVAVGRLQRRANREGANTWCEHLKLLATNIFWPGWADCSDQGRWNTWEPAGARHEELASCHLLYAIVGRSLI